MFSGRISPIVSLVLLAQSLGTSASGAEYVFRAFDLPGGAPSSATGINAAGRVVGYYSDPQTGQLHGFLRSTDGTMSRMSSAHSTSSACAAARCMPFPSCPSIAFSTSGC